MNLDYCYITIFDNVFPRRKLSVTPRNELSSEKTVHVRNSQRNLVERPHEADKEDQIIILSEGPKS